MSSQSANDHQILTHDHLTEEVLAHAFEPFMGFIYASYLTRHEVGPYQLAEY